MFRFVSGANFLGEIVEWCGYAVAAWSLPSFAFAFFTICSIGPRACHHHRYLYNSTDIPPQLPLRSNIASLSSAGIIRSGLKTTLAPGKLSFLSSCEEPCCSFRHLFHLLLLTGVNSSVYCSVDITVTIESNKK